LGHFAKTVIRKVENMQNKSYMYLLPVAFWLALSLAFSACGKGGSVFEDTSDALSSVQESSTPESSAIEAFATESLADDESFAEESIAIDSSSVDESKAEEHDERYNKEGFVLLTDVVPDAVLEMRYYSTFNFVGERIDGYEAPVAYITKEAAAALKRVSDDVMAKGYRLKIYDAYRPQTAVDHFKRWAADPAATEMKPYFYPELDKSKLFKGYIASKSGHSRGSTVDLTLIDMKTGREVDMGGGFDYFGQLSHPDYKDLTEEQIANRNILREAMLNAGFKPTATEWWHFTLRNEPYPNTYFDFPITMPEE